MLLFVGLGNPTPNSQNNRHNVGFKIIDAINLKFGLSKQKPKFKGLLTTGNINEKKIYGRIFNEDEFLELVKKPDGEFLELINNKYLSIKKERITLLGKKNYEDIEKKFFLQVIDQNWKMHIQYLEQLRQVIGLRSYGNRDPLIEYKKEAFSLFENLLEKLKTDFVTIIANISIIQDNNNQIKSNKKKIDPKFIGKKIGRNEPCFCGSGKKYKHCCGSL